MNARRILFVIALSLSALALVACGRPQSLPPRSISVELVEFTITPDAYAARVGEPLAFEVSNKGVLEHNLTLVNAERKELSVVTVAPGQTASFDFTPSAPGQLQVICTVAGHHKAGMTAQLTIGP